MTALSRRQLLALLAASALPLSAARGALPQSVVIVGAGIAGLSAAEMLIRRGIAVTVLEARPRIGGRAVTDLASFNGQSFDLGADRLWGGQDNPLAIRLDGTGSALQPADPRALLTLIGAQAAGADFDTLMDNLQQAIGASAVRNLRLDRLQPQNLSEQLALSLLGPQKFGMDLKNLDPGEIVSAVPGTGHVFVKGGMGQALLGLFKNIPVRLNTPVSEINWQDNQAEVTTKSGEKVRAERVIITASTGVLAAGRIRFTPELPATHQQALANLPMGVINRTALLFDGDMFGPDIKPYTQLRAITSSGAIIEATLKAGSDSLAVVSLGGPVARELEQQSESAALHYALSGLTNLLGSAIEQAFIKGKSTRWGIEPWTLGSISAARPGQTQARTTLAQPVGPLLFAGEALAGPWSRTLAGAYLSGREAAGKALLPTENMGMLDQGPQSTSSQSGHISPLENDRRIAPLVDMDEESPAVFDETTIRHVRPGTP